jgi:hypothetical protein
MTIKKGTPVMFRVFPDDQVIALFPTLFYNSSKTLVTSYMHVGQHSSADLHGVIHISKKAKKWEYEELLEELISIGYDDLIPYAKWDRRWE